jgi:hypothetical protein
LIQTTGGLTAREMASQVLDLDWALPLVSLNVITHV